MSKYQVYLPNVYVFGGRMQYVLLARCTVNVMLFHVLDKKLCYVKYMTFDNIFIVQASITMSRLSGLRWYVCLFPDPHIQCGNHLGTMLIVPLIRIFVIPVAHAVYWEPTVVLQMPIAVDL